jgi:hypothetical protein
VGKSPKHVFDLTCSRISLGKLNWDAPIQGRLGKFSHRRAKSSSPNAVVHERLDLFGEAGSLEAGKS